MNIKKGSIVLISSRAHGLYALGWVSNPRPHKNLDLIQVVFLDWYKKGIGFLGDNSSRWNTKARRGFYNSIKSVEKTIGYDKFPAGGFVIDRKRVMAACNSHAPFKAIQARNYLNKIFKGK